MDNVNTRYERNEPEHGNRFLDNLAEARAGAYAPESKKMNRRSQHNTDEASPKTEEQVINEELHRDPYMSNLLSRNQIEERPVYSRGGPQH
jgi:hypothetical protein